MSNFDLEKERRRLVEYYAGLLDGELETIAEDKSALTEVAQQILEAELSRRKIEPAAEEAVPPVTGVDLQNLVTVRKFRDLPEALLAKGSLESSGIECFLADDNMIRLDWFISNLLGGIKLMVKPEDVEAASDMLDQPIPEELEVEGVGHYQQPRCPSCDSLDVSFRELNKPVAYLSAGVLSLPIPLQKTHWNCHSCGQEWEDVPTPDAPQE